MSPNTVRRIVDEKQKAVEGKIAEIIPAVKTASPNALRAAAIYVEQALENVRRDITELKTKANGRVPKHT